MSFLHLSSPRAPTLGSPDLIRYRVCCASAELRYQQHAQVSAARSLATLHCQTRADPEHFLSSPTSIIARPHRVTMAGAAGESWLPVESNPDAFNAYAAKLGLDTSAVRFVDVMSTEEWALAMVVAGGLGPDGSEGRLI